MGQIVKLVAGRAKPKAALPKPRDCEACEEPIETARLQAIPSARRCIGCAQAQELRQRRILEQAEDSDIVIIRGKR